MWLSPSVAVEHGKSSKMNRRGTMDQVTVSDWHHEAIVADRAVAKSRVPAAAIPRGVNYVLGGLAG